MAKHRVNVNTSDDGQLVLFQRTDPEGHIKPTWYYDIIIPKQKRIRFRSTGYQDYNKAFLFANTQYQKTLVRINAGIPLDAVTFRDVANEAFGHYQGKLSLGEIKQHTLDRMRNSIDFVFVPYFTDIANKDFHEITALDIQEMVIWRKDQGSIDNNRMHKEGNVWDKTRIPSNATINRELTSLRQIYNYAILREIMIEGQRPKIETLKHSIKENRREHFNNEEWEKITNHLWRSYAPWREKEKEKIKGIIEQGNKPNIEEYLKLLNRHFWLTLSQSSGRVGEIRDIKWKDVNIREFASVDSKKIKRLILSVNGKTGKRNIVCMPRSLETFDRWKEICEYHKMSCEKEDYVWRHPWFGRTDKESVNKPVLNTYEAFKRVLTHLDLLFYGEPDQAGRMRERTLYSIRHSAITWALQRNVPIEAISKNVGSSIETLQRVYDHSVATDYMMLITQQDPTHMDEHTNY